MLPHVHVAGGSVPRRDTVSPAAASTKADPCQLNLLLASLDDAELARVRPHLDLVYLEHRERLFEADERIRYVYFPATAVVSLINRLADNMAVEVGTAGCEGMAGLTLFLTDYESPVTAIAQVPGVAGRMSAESFALLASGPGRLHDIMLRYSAAFLCQVAQTAACNGRHLVEQRCARWLLMTHDRVRGNSLPLTHEFLAFMLGVRRAGVSVAMQQLQDSGLVRYSRGVVQVVDRPGLELLSCECYATVRAHFNRLLPRPVTPNVALEA